MTSTEALDIALKQRGLTRRTAAKKARICEGYLLRLWRRGRAPQTVAASLSALLGVAPTVFLWGYPHYLQHDREQ